MASGRNSCKTIDATSQRSILTGSCPRSTSVLKRRKLNRIFKILQNLPEQYAFQETRGQVRPAISCFIWLLSVQKNSDHSRQYETGENTTTLKNGGGRTYNWKDSRKGRGCICGGET
jgi:hypothetical protein